MRQRELKIKRKPLRLDKPVDGLGHGLPVFDLEVVHRSFRDSLLVAGLFRRPAKYLRGPSGAAR